MRKSGSGLEIDSFGNDVERWQAVDSFGTIQWLGGVALGHLI